MDNYYFISYASEDRALAQEMALLFEKYETKFFLDVIDIRWGEKIKNRIDQSLERCSAVVVIVSEASNTSQWVPYEIGSAEALKKGILPFVVGPTLKLPDILFGRKYITQLSELEAHLEQQKESLRATGSIFHGVIDDIGEEIVAHRQRKEVREKEHSVQLLHQGSELRVFNRIDGKEVLAATITYADFARLDDGARNQIEVYETAMYNYKDQWDKLYRQKGATADPEINAALEKKLDDLAEKFCTEFNKIIDFLGYIGWELEDHYHVIRSVCQS